jgi:adenylosuccinate lyase
MREAGLIVLEGLSELSLALKARAKEHKRTMMMGRSHGIHAEPTTFGLKCAMWWQENERNIMRMQRAVDAVSCGKISGAVGTFAHIDPRVEEHVCRKLGLRPEPVATQIVQRDRHAEYLATMAVVGASLEKIALEVRHLQRTEVREAEEPFAEKQKGSSAMPHKRNPVVAERICGLARLLRGNALVGLENVALWHERDISHSSAERVAIPDSAIVLDYMVAKATWLVRGLRVFPARMQRNVESSGGLVFSQKLLLALAAAGMSREDAYRVVQALAMRVWEHGGQLRDLAAKDPAVLAALKPAQLEAAFDPAGFLVNVDHIFKRIGL